jgi:hypothetical protein
VLMVMINDGSVEWWREAHIWCSTVVVLFWKEICYCYVVLFLALFFFLPPIFLFFSYVLIEALDQSWLAWVMKELNESLLQVVVSNLLQTKK